jgi:hypothetical protein
MSTAGPLTDRTKKELAEMARRQGVRGWEAMSKEDLLKALARVQASKNKPADKTNRLSNKPANGKQMSKHSEKAESKTPAKAIPKPVEKLLPKTAAKPAAKITKPAKPGSGVPSAATVLPANPVANGLHNTTIPNGLATSKPIAGLAAPKPTVGLASAKPAVGLAAPKPAVGLATPKPAVTPNQAKSAAPAGKNSAPSATAAARPDAAKSASSKTAAPPIDLSRDPNKDLPRPVTGPTKDRIIMAVHDPYWLHVSWELSAQSVQRAEAALKQDWYGAKLIIRLYDVTSQDTTSTSETPIRDIPIESDGSNWYINVSQPPRQYRADLGYISRRGYLFVLARSNVVTPPKAGSSEAIDASWNMDTKKAERILAMSTGFESSGNPDLREVFEERLKRSLGAPKETGFGTGATPPGSLKKFFFEIDAKLIVFGRTDPTAHLTLGNDPIKLDANGTFMMSFSLPDSRQIIPAVATSADGVEERTIVLAVERNTKYLDPMIHDQMNEI